jgi:hypothetical protein
MRPLSNHCDFKELHNFPELVDHVVIDAIVLID